MARFPDDVLQTFTIQLIIKLVKMQEEQDLFDVMQLLAWNQPQPLQLLTPPSHNTDSDLVFSQKNPEFQPAQSLIPSSASISTSVSPQKFAPKDNSPLAQLDKKSKNKMAAKESRVRKNAYIKAMEISTQAMEEQLQKIEAEIEESRRKITIIKVNQQQNITGNFVTEIGQVYSKLKDLVLQDQNPKINSEIDLCVDSLCYRFAVLGRERVNLIDKGYSHILQLGIPPLHKYIMWAAKKGCHLFTDDPSLNQEAEQWFQMRPLLGNLSENREKIESFRHLIVKQRQRFGESISALMQKKKEMTQLCGQIDDLHMKVRAIYRPKQVAHKILFQESIKYKEEFKYLENICDEEEQEVVELGRPKKLQKREHKE